LSESEVKIFDRDHRHVSLNHLLSTLLKLEISTFLKLEISTLYDSLFTFFRRVEISNFRRVEIKKQINARQMIQTLVLK
jgi:hypothetical protein